MRNSHRSSEYAIWLASSFILLCGVNRCPADKEDLLALVRAGHRAARQSLHSFSATVTKVTTSANKPKRTLTGKYWRVFDTVRSREKVGNGWQDYLLKDSELRSVGQSTDSKGQKRYGASRKPSTAFLGMIDAWSEMMIEFAGPNGGRYDLDRFLEFAKEPPRANRERKDGRDCIRIEFCVVSEMGVEQNITLWHDVGYNYLVREGSMTMTIEKSTYRSVGTIVEFAEPSPGLFVPVKCHDEYYHGRELKSSADSTLSDIQVNKPIPKSVFQLPAIPAGTVVSDTIQGTIYPIDENWRPTGPAQPFVMQRFPAPSGNGESSYHSQSTSEARSFSWWLISGSLGILALACIYRIYRHYRSPVALHQVD